MGLFYFYNCQPIKYNYQVSSQICICIGPKVAKSGRGGRKNKNKEVNETEKLIFLIQYISNRIVTESGKKETGQ